MRFASNDKSNPSIGDLRIVKKFLLFPKYLQNSDGFMEARWFEVASIEQIYEERTDYDCPSADAIYMSSTVDWFDNRWAN